MKLSSNQKNDFLLKIITLLGFFLSFNYYIIFQISCKLWFYSNFLHYISLTMHFFIRNFVILLQTCQLLFFKLSFYRQFSFFVLIPSYYYKDIFTDLNYIIFLNFSRTFWVAKFFFKSTVCFFLLCFIRHIFKQAHVNFK